MSWLPPIFLSHGGPTIVIEDTAAHHFLTRFGRDYEAQYGRPRAILCVTAHWDTPIPAAGAAPQPETIYDFWGFPDELYRLRYPAAGAPDVATDAAGLMAEAGLRAAIDPGCGFDHGVWIPLLLAWPQADIPVVPVAVQSHADPEHHRRMGRALAPLAEQGVLIIGSGAATHNLRDAFSLRARGITATPDWARTFDDWIDRAITDGDEAALDAYRTRAPHAHQAHPTDEHLLPLFAAFGAAGPGARGTRIHGSFDYGSLSMSAWRFDRAAA